MNRCRAIVFAALLAFASAAGAQDIDCLRFMPVGICVWLTCIGPFCSINTSVKFGHFNPDVLVLIDNPQGVNRVEDAYRTDSQNRNHQNLIYRESLALGHPLAGQIYCPSQAEAFNPYFISALDVLGWRLGFPDNLFPPSFIPGLREIGNWPFNTWGAVYPRSGWTIQSEEPKAAAINAQRTGDIITRIGQPHVYQPLTGPAVGGNKLTWPPLISLTENTNLGGDWQLHPSKPAASEGTGASGQGQQALPNCEVFGSFDVFSLTGWGGGKVASDGEYLLTLWRPYTCCEIEGAIFLFAVDFIPYPPPNAGSADTE